MANLKLFTIGFTRKSAETFFALLSDAGVRRVIDIRLNNVSQLAGFSRRDDLRYFLRAICGIDYEHRLDWAPIREILEAVRKEGAEWSVYEKNFRRLIADRRIEKSVPKERVHNTCLLCSEERPDRCHRRLVAEYLRGHWGDLEIIHLV